jgi:hypothetical protein
VGADILAGEYGGMGRWDGRNARDRTSMGLLLEPTGGTSTNGDSLRMRVPPSVTKYDLHHGPEVATESCSSQGACSQHHLLPTSLGSQRQPSCQCLRHRNPRHGAEGPIAPARYATTRLHTSHPLRPIVIPSAHPRALSVESVAAQTQDRRGDDKGSGKWIFRVMFVLDTCHSRTRPVRDHTKTNAGITVDAAGRCDGVASADVLAHASCGR